MARSSSGSRGPCLCLGLLIVALVARAFSSSPRPVVAVVVSGAMRTLPECQPTIKKYILDANPSMDFHFYVYVTVDEDEEVANAQQLVSAAFPVVKSVLVLSGKQISRAVKRALPGLDSIPPGRGTARGKAGNIAKMLLGITLAERLRELPSPPVVRHHMPPARNLSASMIAQHDLVLRLRPDLCFCRPLNLAPLLGSRAVHVPWRAPGMAFDQIAAGPPDLMARYTGAFDSTLPKDVALRRELYPERALGRHLEHERLPLRTLRGFHASLGRGGMGRPVSYADPYGKLKLDLPNVSFPAHACERKAGGKGRGGRQAHAAQGATG